MTVPAVLNEKGVWRNPFGVGDSYQVNDLVSRRGLFYYSTVSNNLSVPGVDPSWTAMPTAANSRVVASALTLGLVNNSIAETNLASMTLPGGLVGAGDKIKIQYHTDWLNNTGANVNFSWRFKIAGNVLFSLLLSSQATNANRRYTLFEIDGIVLSTTQIVWTASWNQFLAGAAASTFTSSVALQAWSFTALDTTTAKVFDFTMQMGTASTLAEYAMRAASMELIKAG